MTPLAVFDCMVFLQGAARPRGPARACFRLVDDGKITLCVSADILGEVRDVLTRPKVQKKFAILTPQWVEEFVSNIQSKAVLVEDVPKAFPLERDPKDEPYVNLAIATKSPYLVSRDKDLLDLMNDKNFRGRYPTLTILNPAAFVGEIAKLSKEASSTEPRPS